MTKELLIRPAEGGDGFVVIWEGYDRDTAKVDALRVSGDFIIEEIDLNRYVQVAFLPGDTWARLYTYIDPFGDLEVGDLVDVPTRYEDHNVAVVKKIGDGYKGRSHATVNGRYFKQDKPVPRKPSLVGYEPAHNYEPPVFYDPRR